MQQEQSGKKAEEAFVITRYVGGRPPLPNRETLTDFLHVNMRPWEDKREDVLRGIDYALSTEKGQGGFVLTVHESGELVGALVMLDTGMKGYIPEHILLFVCVTAQCRGRGIGRVLVERAISECDGAVKLHVEADNPALHLYRRVGFKNDYLEMRYHP
jgi:[ribosomal protein S18]-alanine N-acetyltransferase